jgi:LysM repeat protein
LGFPGKKSARFSNPNRLPAAAAPALFGVAAAIALSAQVTPGSALASTTTHHSASAAHLLSAVRPAVAHRPAAAQRPAAASLPGKYTVRSGDSLSTIAQKLYHDTDAWPALYWANRHQIRWANIIDAGQVLTVPVKPARIPGAPSQLGPAPAAPAPEAPEAAPQQGSYSASAGTSGTPAPAQAASTYSGTSSFQQCVIARESGGNSQVMNSSGHYGLYQFSASTWAAYGGNPADFGNASVAEQNQVFDNAIAAGGQSNWSAYDGC